MDSCMAESEFQNSPTMPMLATCAYFHPPILISIIHPYPHPPSPYLLYGRDFPALHRPYLLYGGVIISFFDTLWSVLPVTAPISTKVFYLPCKYSLPFC